MTQKILSTLIILAGIQGFAAPQNTASELAPTGQPVAIKGYETGATGITFQVPTGGCTTKDSFKVNVSKDAGGTALALVRMQPDTCLEYAPYGTKVTYSYADIGVAAHENFHILNPNGDVHATPGFNY